MSGMRELVIALAAAAVLGTLFALVERHHVAMRWLDRTADRVFGVPPDETQQYGLKVDDVAPEPVRRACAALRAELIFARARQAAAEDAYVQLCRAMSADAARGPEGAPELTSVACGNHPPRAIR